MSLAVCIKKHFPDFTLDVSLAAENETLGLLGASGCGKSLTMRCIAGIETPDEGSIIVNGKTFFDSEKKINLSAQERKTALLFQNYMLFPNLTVGQNIAAGIDKDIPKNEKTQVVMKELKRFGLDGFEKRYPAQLSGGQQQRVALARMLAANPGILMLDEPFSALDAHLKSVLEQNLVNLFDAFEGTILYVSHDIDEALRFCDRIAVVEEGTIVEEARGDDLVNHPKSLAGIKLSGCKNAPAVEYVDDYCIRVPVWGIELATEEKVPKDVKYMGVRASFIKPVESPGENVFRVRVNQSSNARFEKMVLLGFLDRGNFADEQADPNEDDMRYLAQHLFWRVDKLLYPKGSMPEDGEELLIHIPKHTIYLTTR